MEVLIRMKRAVAHFCRYLPIGAAVLGLAVVPAGARAHRANSHTEAAVKAAYLYRFAGYVDWPEEASSIEPFTIAILGSPAAARELKRLLPNHYVNNRPAQVYAVTDRGRRRSQPGKRAELRDGGSARAIRSLADGSRSAAAQNQFGFAGRRGARTRGSSAVARRLLTPDLTGSGRQRMRDARGSYRRASPFRSGRSGERVT